MANLNLTMPGSFAYERDMALPREDMLTQLEAVAGSDHVHCFDFKSLAVAAAGDAVYSNLVCLGMAYQKGLVPVSDQAIRQVISENYGPLEARGNILAFEWGRRAAQDPDRVESLLGTRGEVGRGRAAAAAAPAVESRQSGKKLVGDSAGARVGGARDGGVAIGIENLVRVRVSRLHSYQDRAYAERYLSLVRKIHSIEGGLARACDGGAGVAGEELEGDVASYPLTAAVALNYYKVLAFKDEFEVSRLHLAYGPPLAQLAQEFEQGDAHVYTRARARTRTRTHACTHALTHARAITHARTHTRTHLTLAARRWVLAKHPSALQPSCAAAAQSLRRLALVARACLSLSLPPLVIGPLPPLYLSC